MAQTITEPPPNLRHRRSGPVRALSFGLGGALHGGRGQLRKALAFSFAALLNIEFGPGSQINVPIAILIWLMITPMMMKVDFSSIKNVGRARRDCW